MTGWRATLARARPSARDALVGAPLWAALLAGSAAAGLAGRGWSLRAAWPVVLLFALSGGAGFLPAVWAARLIAGARASHSRRLAAGLVSLGGVSLALAAALYALHYRLYYSQWHEPLWTTYGLYQLVFTSLVAAYQFAALGLPLLYPLGFAGLFAASVALSAERR